MPRGFVRAPAGLSAAEAELREAWLLHAYRPEIEVDGSVQLFAADGGASDPVVLLADHPVEERCVGNGRLDVSAVDDFGSSGGCEGREPPPGEPATWPR